jgi:hypothetical protein
MLSGIGATWEEYWKGRGPPRGKTFEKAAKPAAPSPYEATCFRVSF